MYAIAYYKNTEGTYVATAGGMNAHVVRDLKTIIGILRRAIKLQSKGGRGELFALEVWRDEANRYKPADLVYEADGARYPLTNTPFVALASAFNARAVIA